MTISIWQHASREPKILGIPCMAYTPIFIFLAHMRPWTFVLAIGVIAFFGVLAYFGLTFKVMWARFFHVLRGSIVYARPWWYRNRFRDLD